MPERAAANDDLREPFRRQRANVRVGAGSARAGQPYPKLYRATGGVVSQVLSTTAL